MNTNTCVKQASAGRTDVIRYPIQGEESSPRPMTGPSQLPYTFSIGTTSWTAAANTIGTRRLRSIGADEHDLHCRESVDVLSLAEALSS